MPTTFKGLRRWEWHLGTHVMACLGLAGQLRDAGQETEVPLLQDELDSIVHRARTNGSLESIKDAVSGIPDLAGQRGPIGGPGGPTAG